MINVGEYRFDLTSKERNGTRNKCDKRTGHARSRSHQEAAHGDQQYDQNNERNRTDDVDAAIKDRKKPAIFQNAAGAA